MAFGALDSAFSGSTWTLPWRWEPETRPTFRMGDWPMWRFVMIWGFPSHGGTPKSSILVGFFHYKSSSYWDIPISGTHHLSFESGSIDQVKSSDHRKKKNSGDHSRHLVRFQNAKEQRSPGWIRSGFPAASQWSDLRWTDWTKWCLRDIKWGNKAWSEYNQTWECWPSKLYKWFFIIGLWSQYLNPHNSKSHMCHWESITPAQEPCFMLDAPRMLQGCSKDLQGNHGTLAMLAMPCYCWAVGRLAPWIYFPRRGIHCDTWGDSQIWHPQIPVIIISPGQSGPFGDSQFSNCAECTDFSGETEFLWI